MWTALFFSCLLFLVITLVLLARLSRTMLKIQERIDESLDILEQSYTTINKILETPVFFDSPEIRQVISEIERVYNSILYVANGITLNDDVKN